MSNYLLTQLFKLCTLLNYLSVTSIATKDIANITLINIVYLDHVSLLTFCRPPSPSLYLRGTQFDRRRIFNTRRRTATLDLGPDHPVYAKSPPQLSPTLLSAYASPLSRSDRQKLMPTTQCLSARVHQVPFVKLITAFVFRSYVTPVLFTDLAVC